MIRIKVFFLNWMAFEQKRHPFLTTDFVIIDVLSVGFLLYIIASENKDIIYETLLSLLLLIIILRQFFVRMKYIFRDISKKSDKANKIKRTSKPLWFYSLFLLSLVLVILFTNLIGILIYCAITTIIASLIQYMHSKNTH